MVCSGCHRITSRRFLCGPCRARLSPAGERVLPGGIRVIAGFRHSGPARNLVGGFKYRGLPRYAELVAQTVLPRLPMGILVPVPRCATRLARYGIDPGHELARAIAKHSGMPIGYFLKRRVHTSRRAGRNRSQKVSQMSARTSPQVGLVLVDDVVTTGATAVAAARVLGFEKVRAVVAANVVSEVSGLVLQSTPQWAPDL